MMELLHRFPFMEAAWNGLIRRRVILWWSPGASYMPEQLGTVVIPVTDLPYKGADRT